MKIAYNKDGLPYMIDEDNTILEFSNTNSGDIIAELSTNKELLQEVKNAIVNSIDDKIGKYNIMPKETPEELNSAIKLFGSLGSFMSIAAICEQSEEAYYQNITEQPFDSWVWSRDLKNWISPVPIPYGEEGEYFSWNEEKTMWELCIDPPGADYVWSDQKRDWEPIVKYPIDAAPDEFVWDDINGGWVLNHNRNA